MDLKNLLGTIKHLFDGEEIECARIGGLAVGGLG